MAIAYHVHDFLIPTATNEEASNGTVSDKALVPSNLPPILSTKQDLSTALTSIAGLSTAADQMIYTTAENAYATTALTSVGRDILAGSSAEVILGILGGGTTGIDVFQAETAADIRALLALEPGTDVQAQSAILQSLADETLTAGDILYAADADTIANLPIGTEGQALGVSGGALAWFDAAGDMTQAVYDPQGKAGDAFPYDSVADAEAATIPLTVNSIRLTGYYAAGDGGGALYKRTATEPSHVGKFQSADGAWWEIAEQILFMRMIGCVGDYDPVTRTGTDDTQAIEDAFAASIALGRELRTGVGIYYHLGELIYPAGLRLQGYRRDLSQIYLEVGSGEGGGRVIGQNVYIADIGHVVYNTVVLGGGDGDFASGWSLTEGYFVDGVPEDNQKITLLRCGAYVAPDTPNLPAHGISGTGRVGRVVIDDFECIGFGGAAVQCHWGANGPAFDEPLVDTYHPNTIEIRNVVGVGLSRVLTLSNCYSVKAQRLFGIDCKRFAEVLAGDEGLSEVVSDQVGLAGRTIHISDFYCTGLEFVSTMASLRVLSIGTSQSATDPNTGLERRNIVFWNDVVIERGVLIGDDDVERAIDLTGTCGNVTFRDIDVTGVARLGIGVRCADNRGNILVENIKIASQTAIEQVRSKGVKFRNITAKLVDKTGMPTTTLAITASGAQYTSALAADMAVGATSITMTAAFGTTGVMRPGDALLVDGKTVIVSGIYEIRSTDTIIPIEPALFAATTGDVVSYNQFAEPDIQNSVIDGYDFGANFASTTQKVIFDKNQLIDISRIGLTAISESGRFNENLFLRGGQIVADEPTYGTRNMVLSAGAENIWIMHNQFGIDAEYIDVCLLTSVDTGNLRVKDNAFENAVDAHVSFGLQSNARLDASQYNEMVGNYRLDGGLLDSPASWYEILQGGIVRYHGSAAPTRGFHRAGSEWRDTGPTVGTPVGGMCTSSGTPGIWVDLQNL